MARKDRSHEVFSEDMLLTEDSPFLMTEDYKALRTNVSFSFPSQGAKCIAVTSAQQHEGKSTNALNLAISYAQLGKKVLLIDCDLRLPTIAAKLKIKTQSGLSNLLVGDSPVSEAVKYSAKRGIYVMSAGWLPPDPTKLLASQNMGAVINALKKTFDYIILDCPPVNVVIDAAILAPYVDGYLLVVRHSQTEHREIAKMLDQLNRANANILGFVYTNAPYVSRKYYQSYYNRDND